MWGRAARQKPVHLFCCPYFFDVLPVLGLETSPGKCKPAQQGGAGQAPAP